MEMIRTMGLDGGSPLRPANTINLPRWAGVLASELSTPDGALIQLYQR